GAGGAGSSDGVCLGPPASGQPARRGHPDGGAGAVAVTWARRIWSTVGLIVIVVTGIAVHDQTDTTYAGSDPRLLWSQVAVALALLGAGALTVSPRRSLALAALGGLWLVPELAGWRTGPP